MVVSRKVPGPYLSNKNLGSADEIVLFVSSGQDLIAERDHFCALVEVVDEQMYFALRNRPDRLHLRATRWENDAAQRAYGDPNGVFRDMASSATLTVVLLHNDLRPGTRNEILAALKRPEVQIAVLCFQPEDASSPETKRLLAFLDRHKKRFLWNDTGPPGSKEASLTMLKVVARASFDGWRAKFLDDEDLEPYVDDYK